MCALLFAKRGVQRIERENPTIDSLSILRRRRRRRRRREIRHVMFQKAKTIKKTIKTEVKAMVHGQERVDKRGKPVTSIADRTNVRAAHKTFLFYSHFSSSGFTRLWKTTKEKYFCHGGNALFFVCAFASRRERAHKSFSHSVRARRKTTEKRRDTFYDDDHHHHHHRRPDAACFSLFSFYLHYRRSFRNLSRRKSTRNWKTRA